MRMKMKMKIKMKMKNLKKNKIVKDANIKELIEGPKKIKSPNWLDKNKFKEILTIIDSNKFGHKNKIGILKNRQTLDILTVKTWLTILKIIQVVKQMLKMFKYIKNNKKFRNKT